MASQSIPTSTQSPTLTNVQQTEADELFVNVAQSKTHLIDDTVTAVKGAAGKAKNAAGKAVNFVANDAEVRESQEAFKAKIVRGIDSAAFAVTTGVSYFKPVRHFLEQKQITRASLGDSSKPVIVAKILGHKALNVLKASLSQADVATTKIGQAVYHTVALLDYVLPGKVGHTIAVGIAGLIRGIAMIAAAAFEIGALALAASAVVGSALLVVAAVVAYLAICCIPIVGTALSIVTALAIYDHFIVQPRQAKQDEVNKDLKLHNLRQDLRTTKGKEAKAEIQAQIDILEEQKPTAFEQLMGTEFFAEEVVEEQEEELATVLDAVVSGVPTKEGAEFEANLIAQIQAAQKSGKGNVVLTGTTVAPTSAPTVVTAPTTIEKQ